MSTVRRAWRATTRWGLAAVLLLLAGLAGCATGRVADAAAGNGGRIQPYPQNPFYWQFRGAPVLLIGATDYHNIFQRLDLVEQLEWLHAAGGNLVRNSMASREIFPDHRDLWPFAIVRGTDDPLINVYDLDRWNPEYWDRFEALLRETAARGMIVELELWERHDYYRTRDQAGWLRHPYNPDNNVNYTVAASGLPGGQFPAEGENPYYPPPHPFFQSVPALENNEFLLPYQRAFIDKILSYSLRYDHVLYNMNNETQEPNEWGEFWAEYVRARAAERGMEVELTDMQDAHDVTDDTVTRMATSGLYTFVDISQNNFQAGDTHWERILHIRELIRDRPKPITNIKIYGADGAPPPQELWGTERDGIERFWRNIVGGTSAVRFHRPGWGIGLSEAARAHVRSARMLADAMEVWNAEPRNDLLTERAPNSAFLLAEPGRHYALYIPDGGEVTVDLSTSRGPFTVRWLDAAGSRWIDGEPIVGGEPTRIRTPMDGHWLLLLTAVAEAPGSEFVERVPGAGRYGTRCG
jgi:hypothetical protein